MNINDVLEKYLMELITNENLTSDSTFQNLVTKKEYLETLKPVIEILNNNPDIDYEEAQKLIFKESNIKEELNNFIKVKELTPGLVIDFGFDNSKFSIVAGNMQEYTVLNNNKVFYPIPMHHDTIFDLASTSKLFTTISILKLVQENYLNIFDPITKYVPEFTNLEDITIFDLLKFKVHIKTKVRIDTAKSKEEAEKILFTAYKYENQDIYNAYTDIGAMVLRYVVERVTNMPFNNFVNEAIFKVLHMDDTYLNVPQEKIERVANENFSMKVLSDGTISTLSDNIPGTVHDSKALAMGSNYGIAPGHAGYFSTAHDMMTLGEALCNYTFLNKEAIYSISENVCGKVLSNNDSTYYYGSLVYVKQLDNNKLGVYHKLSGKTFMSPGFAGTSLYVDPLNKITLFMGSNRLHNRIYDINKNINENILTNEGKQTYNGELVSLNYTLHKEKLIQKILDLTIELQFLDRVFSHQKLVLKKDV